jgi:hypothetical protein
MKTSFHQLNNGNNRGYTLLFAVLFSSLLLAIAISILFISKKEVELSSSGRESQFAFYAADTGIECALYHDTVQNAFATSSEDGEYVSKDIYCNNIKVWEVADSPVYEDTPVLKATSDFRIDFTEGYCAEVSVIKEDDDGDISTLPLTIIRSKGYNTCVTTDPRRVERLLITAY